MWSNWLANVHLSERVNDIKLTKRNWHWVGQMLRKDEEDVTNQTVSRTSDRKSKRGPETLNYLGRTAHGMRPK